MTKRDAIEAMARAMALEEGTGVQPSLSQRVAMASAAYNVLAEMAKAELQARCSVTGQPLTTRQQFESECG